MLPQVLALLIDGTLHHLQHSGLGLWLHLELGRGAICLGQIFQKAELGNLDFVGGRLRRIAQYAAIWTAMGGQ